MLIELALRRDSQYTEKDSQYTEKELLMFKN